MSLTPELQQELAKGWRHHQASQWADAARHYRKVLKKAPDNEHALHLLGLVCANRGEYADAIGHYRSALKRTPEDAKLWNNLSIAYGMLRQYKEAAHAMVRAIELGTQAPDARGMLVSYRREICDWSRYADDVSAIAGSVEPRKPRVLPGFTIYLDDPAIQLEAGARKCRDEGINLGGHLQQRLTTMLAGVQGKPRDPARIRIAYIFADFRDHPTTHLLLDTLRAHDRERFEVYAISIGPSDAYQERVASAVEHFVDCFQEPPEVTAQRLKRLGIDIAIDLMGHTIGARPAIFCGRPARIQITYLGYPATTGADFFDYIISDRNVTPLNDAHFYSEKIFQIPNTYQPNASARLTGRADTTSRRKENLPEDAFVFCAFNSTHKIDPYIFQSWMNILKNVPNGMLWLMFSGAQDNILASATSAGVDPTRIVFAPRIDQEEHQERIGLADLFLDTFPYTAHTTASDMLRQGIPIITRRGRTFASRVSASLLDLVGMQELVAHDMATYEQLAIGLATAPARLASVRARLSRGVTESPLFRPDIYTRHLERAFELMHARWQAGLPPDHMTVEARI